jgi:hypothetical protein
MLNAEWGGMGEMDWMVRERVTWKKSCDFTVEIEGI